MSGRSILREALGLLRVRAVLAQAALVAVVAGLAVLWLHMPDASAIDVAGSVLLGLVVIWVTGAGETAIFLRLCDTPRTRARLLRGAVLLLVGTGLWIWIGSLIGHVERGDYLRAGYLNSRVSFRWRNLFSFAHISLLLGWMWTAIQWIVAGVIAAVVFPLISGSRSTRAIWRSFFSATYWIVLVLGTIIGTVLTGLLMHWSPGKGVRVEVASIVLRMAAATLLDCSLIVLLLGVLAACVRRSGGASYDSAAGTPVVSQPRTADNP